MQVPKDIDKFVMSTVQGEAAANYVLFGVPENDGSAGLAYFEGSAGGPSAIRKASQLYCAFHRTENGKLQTFITNSYEPLTEKSMAFFDAGDINKTQVEEKVFASLKQGKFPIILGGDHSISYECLRGIHRYHEKFALVYFDAHPDFRSSDRAGRKSYATVVYDASQLAHFDIKHAIQVGISDIENEEFINMKKAGIKSLTALDIEDIGVHKALQTIKKVVGELPVYISVDLDVLDQSFAPAVSTPSPCGLTSRELLFFITELAKENVVGLDIMEHTPKPDDDPETSTVGARLIIEFVVRHSARKNKKLSSV